MPNFKTHRVGWSPQRSRTRPRTRVQCDDSKNIMSYFYFILMDEILGVDVSAFSSGQPKADHKVMRLSSFLHHTTLLIEYPLQTLLSIILNTGDGSRIWFQCAAVGVFGRHTFNLDCHLLTVGMLVRIPNSQLHGFSFVTCVRFMWELSLWKFLLRWLSVRQNDGIRFWQLL